MSEFLADLDRLGAEGRLTNVMLIRAGDRWQVYIKLGRTSGYSSQCAATPSEALAKSIEAVPACEDYDLKNGFGVVEPSNCRAAAPHHNDHQSIGNVSAREAAIDTPQETEDLDDLLG